MRDCHDGLLSTLTCCFLSTRDINRAYSSSSGAHVRNTKPVFLSVGSGRSQAATEVLRNGTARSKSKE